MFYKNERENTYVAHTPFLYESAYGNGIDAQ